MSALKNQLANALRPFLPFLATRQPTLTPTGNKVYADETLVLKFPDGSDVVLKIKALQIGQPRPASVKKGR